MNLPAYLGRELTLRCQVLSVSAPYPITYETEDRAYGCDIVIRYAPGRDRTFLVDWRRHGVLDERQALAAIAFIEGLGAMLDVTQQRAMLDAEAAKAAKEA